MTTSMQSDRERALEEALNTIADICVNGEFGLLEAREAIENVARAALAAAPSPDHSMCPCPHCGDTHCRCPDHAPGHTDLMVSPESIDAFMEANPLPDHAPAETVDDVARDQATKLTARPALNKLVSDGLLEFEELCALRDAIAAALRRAAGVTDEDEIRDITEGMTPQEAFDFLNWAPQPKPPGRLEKWLDAQLTKLRAAAQARAK